ncbi:hypothetical protein [Lacinutrix undariae]
MTKKHIIIGFALGLATTILGIIVGSLVLGNGVNIPDIIRRIIAKGHITKLASFAAVFNIGLFYFFITKQKEDKAKGVIIATILMALITFAINYL